MLLPLETPNSPVTAQIAQKAEDDSTSRLSLSPAFEKGQEAAERVAQVEQHLAVEHLGGVLGRSMRCMGGGVRGVAGVSGRAVAGRISGIAKLCVVRSAVRDCFRVGAVHACGGCAGGRLDTDGAVAFAKEAAGARNGKAFVVEQA